MGLLRSAGCWIAGLLTVLLFGSAAMMSGGAVAPAHAAPGAFPQLVKQVDGEDELHDLGPGDSFTYQVQFSTEDAELDGPVQITDVLPAAFSGWEISGLSATLPGYPGTTTVNLPGVSPADSGVIGSSEEERTITVDVEAPLSGGGTGLPTGPQGVLQYTLTVPSDLDPDWEFNGEDLVNNAELTGFGDPDEEPLGVAADAVVSVDVPITVDVTPAKSWEPSAQNYEPGASSQITVGATQGSNVDADSLVLQDPPSAEDGAAALDPSNPFRYVDFAGFTGDPTDPAGWPEGATGATAEVYVFDGITWNWVEYDGTVDDADVAGVRLSYTGEIVPGATVSQEFGVTQRTDDRLDEVDLSDGYDADNTVAATVNVDGQDPVTEEADATFTVDEVQIDVAAGKTFLDADGSEVEPLRTVAGNQVDAVITAQNSAEPDSSTLDSMTISEPGEGADAAYFSDDLAFAGFDPAYTSEVWPAGATGGTLTWYSDGDPVEVELTPGEALPDPPEGMEVTGFEITFVGAIEPEATSQVKFAVDTDTDLAEEGSEAGPFTNTTDVEGSRAGVDEPATDDAEANLIVVAPSIDVNIDKEVSPSVVFPGEDVVVELPTTATASGDRTRPTEIVVTDEYGGEGTFWDAYDVTAVAAPIDVPAGGTLLIERYDSETGSWVEVATLTESSSEDIPIDDPEHTTGIRFTYTNVDGFGATTAVKPNLVFTARDELRSGGTTTPNQEYPYEPTPYENTAVADATGRLDDRVVTDEDSASESGSIRYFDGDGVGPMWNDKSWTDDLLVSQSEAETSSVQRWGVTEDGFDEVTLTDPATPSSSGVGTVFEAFDLTRIYPITYDQDPLLRWDEVVDVELFDGAEWVSVSPPGGATGWMGENGFVGLDLDEPQQESTLGVRLTLHPDDDARQEAIDNGETAVPSVGSGIAHTAQPRSYELGWQLRDSARTAQPGDDIKWVTSNAEFNCLVPPAAEADPGCIDNTFEITGTQDGTQHSAVVDDMINVLDGVGDVTLEKAVGGLEDGEAVSLVAPKPGDLDQADYPTTWYTLTAENASGTSMTDPDAAGIMKLGKIRVTDVADATLGNSDMGVSPFAGRDFAAEAASTAGNHFDEFNLTGIGFEGLPAYIDRGQSEVELWLYNDGDPTTASYSIAEVEAGAAADDLGDAIGVSVTYQGTDPETEGGRIIAGDELEMRLDVQLRAEHRVSGEPVTGGEDGVPISVHNSAAAIGQDLVVDPEAKPGANDDAEVLLDNAAIDVDLVKSVTVAGGGDTIIEPERDTPVDMLLTATPGDSTAPLAELSIEDDTADFWERFELVSLPEPAAVPTDSDRYRYEYRVDGDWVAQGDFTEALDEVRGVRIIFDRADGQLFPLGATSWTSGWGEAQLPVQVQLRDDAEIDWAGGETVTNVAETTAAGSDGETAEDESPAEIAFSPGEHRVTVEKRAPFDTSTHIVDPLTSMPWQLVITNDGDGYLPIETVTDVLPTSLVWDGEQPSYSQEGGSGLTIDPDEISVGLSDDESQLSFTWPEGSRMEPGEQVTIDLGLILQPGLAESDQAWNAVVAETGVPLDSCTQPTDYGQDASQAPDIEDTQCSNANYVQPRAGTLVGAQKFVNGEYVDTLGENLVSGAVDTRGGVEDCTTPGAPDDYTRTPCADYTAVGGVDHWLLQHANAGTDALGEMTIVDMLPRPGDRLLAGGGSRDSTFRPVLDTDSIDLTGVPDGAQVAIDVTTDPTACIGTGAESMWPEDPECVDPANPGNGSWTALDDFDGAAEAIAGLRVTVEMPETPLAPGEWLDLSFDTVNRVVENTDEGLQPDLAQFVSPQFAWNQNGVHARNTAGDPVNLVKAPQQAGVTLQTGSLEVSKTVVDNGVEQIPETFEAELECTVPSGVSDPERVVLDLGDSATLALPADGTPVTVDGLPIGTDCTISETGELGSYGEVARSFQPSDGVNPSEDGMTAEIRIREPRSGDNATVVGLTNTYSSGQLIIEKSVRSGNEHDLSDDQLDQTFEFDLVCQPPNDDAQSRTFTLEAGEQVVIDDIPDGTVCDLTETGTGGAVSTSITVDGTTTEGTSADDIVIDGGSEVLVSNAFDGVDPEDPDGPGSGGDTDGLPVSGSDLAGLIALALLLLALGGAVLLRNRGRSA